MSTSWFIDRRYMILDCIGEGGMGAVYRAQDRLGGLIALKRVVTHEARWVDVKTLGAPSPTAAAAKTVTLPSKAGGDGGSRPGDDGSESGVRRSTARPADQIPTKEQIVVPLQFSIDKWNARSTVRDRAGAWRLSLAREFRVLATLRHPNIISVLDYGFDEDLQPYYTMELFNDAASIVDGARDEPFERKVTLIGELLQALRYLHRRGVIHRDLKPSNVLVSAGRAKLLDFGIAVTEEDRRSTLLPAGTLAYMAPELFFGQPPQISSDLYAVGLIAYEIFTGRYPFVPGNSHALIQQILHLDPDYQDLPPGIALFLKRLLAGEPARRFADAAEALLALEEASRQQVSGETRDTRESFLSAAQLVGRDRELDSLIDSLDASIEGSGSGILVAGESGVGKSRLMEELRTHALVAGAAVLRGQEVSSGAAPYDGWREVLRRLVLLTDLTDEETAVIRPLVPDIAALVGRDVADAVPLDPQAAHDRLVAAIEALLRRAPKSIVIILDDLQWARSESVALLARITRSAHEMPVLLVGTYRDDERPGLPLDLPAMQLMKLERLTPEAIAQLCSSMLGRQVQSQALLLLLRRETEGNPFLLVEVMRALAEEAGELSSIESLSRPASVLPGRGGFVERRLDRVPPPARPLLRAAAVIGRRLDPALLQRVAPDMPFDEWLTACADAAVIEADEGHFRFSHDKLRESLLARVVGEERRSLHRSAAEAIEQVYPDQPDWYSALALHWKEASAGAKAIDYLEKAGEQALQQFSNREAIACFEEAIALDAAGGQSAGPLRRGRWERGLAQGHFAIGNIQKAMAYGQRALRHFGHPIPDTRLGCLVGIGRAISTRVARPYLPPRRAPSPAAAASLSQAASVTAEMLQHFFIGGKPIEGTYAGLQALSLAERLPPSAALARAYAFMCIVAGMTPLKGVAREWAKRAIDIAERTGSDSALMYSLARVAAYHIGDGRWREADPLLHRSSEMARACLDRRQLEEVYANRFIGVTAYGSMQEALDIASAELTVATDRGDAQVVQWARTHLVEALTALGRAAEGAALVRELDPWLRTDADHGERIFAHGNLAEAHFLVGDQEGARRHADKVQTDVRRSRPVAFFMLNGVVAMANVYLALWEAHGRSEAVVEGTRVAYDVLGSFARLCPFAAPAALRSRGLFQWNQGRRSEAREIWRQALSAAQRLEMLREQARAHALLGRGLRGSSRDHHVERARALFGQAGVIVDVLGIP